MAARIRKDDLVEVIAGRSKGQRGRVLKVMRDQGLVIVENVNKVKRHQSPKRYREAGIIEKEAAVKMSKVMPVDSKSDKRTRVRFETNKDGEKVRVAVRSGTALGR